MVADFLKPNDRNGSKADSSLNLEMPFDDGHAVAAEGIRAPAKWLAMLA